MPRTFFFFLASLLVLPMLATAQGTARFAVVGDFGGYDIGNERTLAVSRLIDSWDPEFIVTTGDNNYPKGEQRSIDRCIGEPYADYIAPYKGQFGQGATTNKFFPSLGNHDWYSITCSGDTCTGPYFDFFELPGNERYYDFVRGPVHFFIINSNSAEPAGIDPNSAQARWLRDKLAASTSCWQAVILHHPPFSSSTRGGTPVMRWPYAAWGADMVLAGHEHLYERLTRDGIPYIITGAGGRSPYNFARTPEEGSEVRWTGGNGASLMNATCAEIQIEFYDTDGARHDQFILQNTSAARATFSQFTVEQSGVDAVVRWATSQELNLEEYVVERSYQGGAFEAVANVPLASSRSYEFRAANLPNGENTFRIRWRGTSGQTNTSEPRSLNVQRSSVTFGALSTRDNAGDIELSWTTTSEDNIESFDVQRSFNGGAFELIGSRAASGKPDSYTFVLPDALSGEYVFRLHWKGPFSQQGLSPTVSITEARPVAQFQGVILEQAFDSLTVRWSTAIEENLDAFAVERLNADGTQAEVATEPAQNQATQYEIALPLTEAGEKVYRVRWAGTNGEVGFSDPVAIVATAQVTWLAFSAEQENEGELFEWQTAREFEIDRYIVEWQVPNGEFAPVDTVAAAGTPVDTTSYSFLIAETPVGMYRFRVEAIGRDGTSTLSPEILTEVVSSVLLNGFEAMLEGFSVRLRWVSIAEIHMES
ncbi:MAG: metallophosphoesterase, partial [Bacteroidota bacterium]